MEVDLTNSELFKSFAEFENEGTSIDLHNQFGCNSIIYSSKEKHLVFVFKAKYSSIGIHDIRITFYDCSIESYSAGHDELDTTPNTIDMIYRGRFQLGNNELIEKLDGRLYYYINFLPNTNFEVLARRVTAVIE